MPTGRIPSTRHVAAVAADLDRPPELERVFLDCGRWLVDQKHMLMAHGTEETGHYRDLPMNDLPVGSSLALGRDDSIGECDDLGVMPGVFRGGTWDAKGLTNGSMMRGTGEDMQQCMGCKDDVVRKAAQPY